MVPAREKSMNPTDQTLIGEWAEMKVRVAIAKEYDFSKFLCTVASATIGFVFTAEKINEEFKMDGPLITAFILLFVAVLVSVVLAMLAPPDKDPALSGTTFKDVIANPAVVLDVVTWRTRLMVALWFILWLAGTWFGVKAVIPT
jgi:hypothetical protein